MTKRYRIQKGCPQCGCSAVANLSEEEIRKRYPDVPNVELECHECLVKFNADLEDDCPEWKAECRTKK